jgi:WD40 repeat protein
MIIKSITRYFTVIFFAQTSTAQQYCVQNISTEEGTVNSLQLWNRNYLLSGSGSFGIKQWDLLDNKFIELDKYSVNRLVIHNNFMFIATGGSDPFIRQYDFLTRSSVRQFDDVGWQVAVNSDFGFGVTNSISIQQFRIADGQAIRQLTGHTSNIRALLIEGDYLFSGSNDGFCKQWLIETGALVRSLSGPGGPIVSLLTVDDLLLLGSMGKIKVYFMSNYSTFQSFTAHSTYIWAMRASGGFLFTASADKLIRQWRLNTWETIRNYTGHRNSVNSIVIIDEYLYSGSSDGFIKKWVVPELKTPSNPSLPNDPPSLLNQKTIIIIGAVAGLICLAIIASIIYITRMRAPAKSSMNSNDVLLSPISTLPRTIYNRNMGTTNSLPRSMVTPSTGSIRTVGINSVRVTAASPITQTPSIAFSDLVRQETPQFTQSQQTQVDPLTTTTQFSQSDRGNYVWLILNDNFK